MKSSELNLSHKFNPSKNERLFMGLFVCLKTNKYKIIRRIKALKDKQTLNNKTETDSVLLSEVMTEDSLSNTQTKETRECLFDIDVNNNDEWIEVDADVPEAPSKRKTGPKPKELVAGIIYGKAVGRNKVIIDPKQVQELSSFGVKPFELCKLYGVNMDTLLYNFKSEIQKGVELGKVTLRKAMFNNAIKNNNAALQIFLAKNMLGMSDNPNKSEDKTPLPWVEDKEDEAEIKDETKPNAE